MKNPFPPKQKVRELSINLSLAVIPLLTLYLIFEFAVFKHLLPLISMRQQQSVPEPIQTLCEVSKKSTMPHRYILMLGDSNADGWGDWVQGNDIDKNEPYGVHDLIYRMTGIDTIECGFAGGSPLETLIRKPINRYRYLRKTWLYKIEDPKHVLFLFYEGNDLSDNLNRFRRDNLFETPLNFKCVYHERYFRWYLETVVPKSDALYYDVKRFRWSYNFVSFRFIKELVRRRLFEKYPKGATGSVALAQRGTNSVMIDGEKVFIPRGDLVTVPNLSEEDFKLSVYMTGECLDVIKDFFPRSKFTIVYIPAPITSYEIISDSVTVKKKEGVADTVVDDTKAVFERSDKVFKAIQKLAQERKMAAIDVRPYFRKAATKQGLLHGTRDVNHLSRVGYTELAKAIVAEMDFSDFPGYKPSSGPRLLDPETVINPFSSKPDIQSILLSKNKKSARS